MKKSIMVLFMVCCTGLSTGWGQEEVTSTPEKMPEYPGGMSALATYVGSNLEYPEKAKNLEQEGTVYVSFVVDRNGSVRDVEVAKGVEPSLNEEALRVVRSLPSWTPGEEEGKPVDVKMVLPVKYVLPNE